NGMILNPGDVFSFNEAVGERTEERGVQPATIYGGEGESVDGVGGGICQVASTIYYTTLYMDLEQVQREPHMYQVTYVPGGMDATVYWDSGLDYKFRNNREHPMKIQANVDGGHVNITFWGVKENDNYVEMTFAVLETFTSEDVEEVDETKEPGYREQKQTAYTGAKVEAYQKVFDGDGKLLKENTIKSTYKSRPNIYIVGPTEEEEVPDPDDPAFDPDDPFYDPDDPFFDFDPDDEDLPADEEDVFWP
ncbi:MAG: VanW family protein, partial [Oscillospiraceae bacterium]|nr:VanW family protein [Oscillospiraceae bacterium]